MAIKLIFKVYDIINNVISLRALECLSMLRIIASDQRRRQKIFQGGAKKKKRKLIASSSKTSLNKFRLKIALN